MASVFKGFTEAISEIGSATSDAALYHSKHLHGDEYASTVTKHYVDGYGGNLLSHTSSLSSSSSSSLSLSMLEIGLGIYKGLNVVSFGVHGLMLDAAVEGTMLSI